MAGPPRAGTARQAEFRGPLRWPACAKANAGTHVRFRVGRGRAPRVTVGGSAGAAGETVADYLSMALTETIARAYRETAAVGPRSIGVEPVP